MLIDLLTLLNLFLHTQMAAALELVGICLASRVAEAGCPPGVDRRC